MKHRNPFFRKATDKTVKVVSFLGAILGIFFLAWILFEVGKRGIVAINWSFFTALPAPPEKRGAVSLPPSWHNRAGLEQLCSYVTSPLASGHPGLSKKLQDLGQPPENRMTSPYCAATIWA